MKTRRALFLTSTSMSIYKKLLDFQKLGVSIRKDKKNPHFKNDYASLDEVLDKVKKPLNDLGLVVIQNPELGGLETIIADTESGEHITSNIPYINATDMQKLGGAITYARRYALIAMLGLEDDDDDGQVASTPAKAAVKSEPQEEYPLMNSEIACERLEKANSVASLTTIFKALPAALQKNSKVINKAKEIKTLLTI